jgi:Astacin (Peptidase family M12A)
MAKQPVAASAASAQPLLTCIPRHLPLDLMVSAAAIASDINPNNHPPQGRMARILKAAPTKLEIAIVTTKRWHTAGVHLTVGFLDNPPANLRKRLLLHMNAWAKTANVRFRESASNPQVRIARAGGPDGGYWSYLGTDILSIGPGEATMNLEGFTMAMPESEFHRVVRHETGHTLGFPHEHMRAELVARIDPAKAIAYFKATQGWTEQEIRAQVLTPIEKSSLLGTEPPDPNSIMCYQIPGTITKDGLPIIGGLDIDPTDYAFAAKIYPKKLL